MLTSAFASSSPFAAHAPVHLAAASAVGLSPLPSALAASLPPATAWVSAAVLAALAARSAVRLAADRTAADPSLPGCAMTSRAGDVTHMVMAAGMTAMVLPLGVPPAVPAVLFGLTTALIAGAWIRQVVRGRVARWRGDVAQCRPVHVPAPHHVIIGLVMVVMAERMGATGTMSAMPGMAPPPGLLSIGAFSMVYPWAAMPFLGGRLLKAAVAQPAPTSRTAMLSAPVTVYACELAMTVVTGLMLLG